MSNTLFRGQYPWTKDMPKVNLTHKDEPDKPTRKEVQSMIDTSLEGYEKTVDTDKKLEKVYSKDEVDERLVGKTGYDYVDGVDKSLQDQIYQKANIYELDQHMEKVADYWSLGHVRAVERVPSANFPNPVAVDENGQLWSQGGGGEGGGVTPEQLTDAIAEEHTKMLTEVGKKADTTWVNENLMRKVAQIDYNNHVNTIASESLGHVRAIPKTNEANRVAVDEDGYLFYDKGQGGGSTTVYDMVARGLSPDNTPEQNDFIMVGLIKQIDNADAPIGDFYIGRGTYYMDRGFHLPQGCNLYGDGQENTTIIFGEQQEGITLENNSSLHDITLIGSTESWINEHQTMFEEIRDGHKSERDFHPYAPSGVIVPDFVGTSSRLRNRWAINHEPIESAYAYVDIYNVRVIGFDGYGFKIGNRYKVHVDNVTATCCGCGIILMGSDNMASRIFIDGSAYTGAILGGSNYKISDVKVCWSGCALHTTYMEDFIDPFLDVPHYANIGYEVSGIVMLGNRNDYINVEAQDCGGRYGIQICGDNIGAYNILSDGNCFVMGQNVPIIASRGISINGVHDSDIHCHVAAYKNTSSSIVRQVEYGITVTYTQYTDIVYSLARTDAIHCCVTPYLYQNNDTCTFTRTGSPKR